MKRFLEIKSNSWINSISTLRQNVQWCNGSIDPTAGYCRCTEGLLIVDVHDAAYDPAYGRVFLKIFTFLLITYERTVNQCRLFAESYHRLICHRTVLYSEELIFSHHAFFVKNRCVVNITPRCYILSCDARCTEGQKCQKKRKIHFYDSVYAKCETQKGTNETKLFSDDEMIIFISCRQHIWTVSDIYVFTIYLISWFIRCTLGIQDSRLSVELNSMKVATWWGEFFFERAIDVMWVTCRMNGYSSFSI